MTERLSAVVVTALRMNPTQRLGQLFCNITSVHNPTLWNMTDEDVTDRFASVTGDDDLDIWGCEYAHIAGGGCALAATVDSPPPAAVQLRDLLDELNEAKQELSRVFGRVRRAEKLVGAVRKWSEQARPNVGDGPLLDALRAFDEQ